MFNKYSFLEWTYGLELERIYILNKYISLNGYNFSEWIYVAERGYISLNELMQFIEMNIISCQNIIASNDYTFCYLKESIFPWQLNKYIISLKLNKYNSLKLHKYTVTGCKIMPLVQMYFV